MNFKIHDNILKYQFFKILTLKALFINEAIIELDLKVKPSVM